MKRWPEIKAVFFDFDDTLGNREKYACDCARAILDENCHIEDPLLKEAILQDWMLWDEKGNIDKTHVKNMLVQKYGIHIDCADMNAYWDARLWKYAVPFDDTAETLEVLQKKYFLGIITNGPPDGQRKKLEQSGLKKFFPDESVTVSGDYDFRKPDKRIFEAAVQKTDYSMQECVYVGDIFANDVAGALKAGMHAVWMWNWGERECSIDVPVIHHLRELVNIL